MIRRPLLLTAGGFVLGEGLVLSKRVVGVGIFSAVAVVLLAFAAEQIFLPEHRGRLAAGLALMSRSMHGKLPVTGMVVALAVLAGACRAGCEIRQCETELAYGLDGQNVTLEGEVAAISEKNGWLILELEDAFFGEGALRRIQVYLDEAQRRDDDVRIGNRLTVSGECASFACARNPGEFDYRLYYRSRKMSYRMFGDSVRVTDAGYNHYREGLRRLSEHASGILARIASEEDAGVLRAVILGDKTQLPEEIRSLYQRNGIAHILAVSGLHLSLVSLAVYGLLRKLGAGYGSAALIGGGFLISYALFTGSGSSVLRALAMTICGFLAAYLGRTYDLLTALGLSAFLIAWDSPYAICQSGVQLSFGALAGIGGLAPCLDKIWEDRQTAAQALRISVSMQLATAPVILYHFFQLPLYGMFLNLLVVPCAGILIGSGVAGIVVGSVWLAGGRFAVGGACVLLRWYERCCLTAERLPGSLCVAGRPEIWQIGVCYGLIIAAVWMGMPARQERVDDNGKQPGTVSAVCHSIRRKLSVTVSVVLACSMLVLLPFPLSGLEATFLDVGQGDGICLRTNRAVILVDGGSSDQKELGENRLVPFLKSRGIHKIDYAIVSHGDQDHISGLTYLLEQETGIRVRHLILPAAGGADESYETLAELALARGCVVRWMERGDRLLLGKLSVTCLYPDEIAGQPLSSGTDRNEHSLALRVDYGAFGMMLTGDMSAQGEKELLSLSDTEERSGDLADIQVLKVAHHGSSSSTSEEWLDAIQPLWAVISCGEGNSYGHPHAEVLSRLRESGVMIYQTPESGAITLKTDGKRIRWRSQIK